MSINIKNNDVNKKLENFSKKYNKSKENIVEEALIVYEDYIELLKKFDSGDNISDEDYIKFENSL